VSPALPREERDAITTDDALAALPVGTVVECTWFTWQDPSRPFGQMTKPVSRLFMVTEHMLVAEHHEVPKVGRYGARRHFPGGIRVVCSRDALDAAEAENGRLVDEVATAEILADSMQHFADVAERVESQNNALVVECDAARAEVAALRGRIEALADECHCEWNPGDRGPGFTDSRSCPQHAGRVSIARLRALAADEGERKAAARYQEATTPNAGDLSAARQYLDTVRRLDPAMGPLCDEVEREGTPVKRGPEIHVTEQGLDTLARTWNSALGMAEGFDDREETGA
jgi:hypothetical protein